ncbi:hypothetical protein [Caulobacter sp. NIBR2454]|uniref:hypothetical protein n=1 Tax=Caulobacter sp. NIBR2454 TaxID=3015996 RepID=UPI0022B69836|nr:hypothetical protein [Caulobacter sp. NIBR2454]
MTTSLSGPYTRQSPPPLIAAFRDSWQAHDIVGLSELFADQFEYIIDGKVRFKNKNELRNYWCLNKLRQKDLSIVFMDAKKRGLIYKSYFFASFFHPYRLSIVNVAGHMEIEVDKSTKKIIKLSEMYDKLEKKSQLYSIEIIVRDYLKPILSWSVAALYPAWEFIRGSVRFLFTWGLGVGIILIAYVNFFHKIRPIISDSEVEALRNYTVVWFGIAYVLQQSLSFLKKNVLLDLSVKGFSGNKDLEHMAKVMDGADTVYIVSGDFSFIDTNEKLEKRLTDLAFAGKLHLIIYKGKDKLIQEMSSKTSSNEILIKLIDNKSIRYNFPIKAKVTIVESGGNRKMLFRFKKEVDGKSKLHMGFINPGENTGYLLNVIESFLENGGGSLLTIGDLSTGR